MSIADSELTQVHERLAQVEVKQRGERRAELLRQLRETRAQLREAHTTYRKLAKQIHSEDNQRAAVTAKLNLSLSAIQQSLQLRPASADYLSADEDAEVAEWTRRHAGLEAERNKLLKQRDAVPQTNRAEAVSYEGPSGTIARMEQVEKNLLAALDGSLGKFGESSISPV